MGIWIYIMSAAEKQPEQFDHEVKNQNPEDLPIEDVTEVLSKLSPEDLVKFRLFNHKFEKILEKVQKQKETECLHTLKRLTGIEKKANESILRKIYNVCTLNLLKEKEKDKSRLKVCSPHITHMDLSVDPETVDNPNDILIELSHHCRCIEDLNLNSCNISVEGIRALQKMNRLKTLSLCFCEVLSDKILKELAQLKQLRTLKLCWNQSLPLSALSFLEELPELHRLDISHTNFTDDQMIHINKLVHLTTLNCEDCQEISNQGIARLTHLKNLKNLTISSSKIGETGLKTIVALFPNLESLSLRNQHFSDETLSQLKNLKHLTNLNLSWSNAVQGHIIDELAELPNLQILDLSHCERLNPISSHWRDFPSLMILNLSYTRVDDDVLRDVSWAGNLENVSFSYSHAITLDGLMNLKRLGSLRFLDLVSCGLEKERVRALFPENVEIRL